MLKINQLTAKTDAMQDLIFGEIIFVIAKQGSCVITVVTRKCGVIVILLLVG